MKPIIEPLIIPQKQLDDLKAVLADPNLPDMHKHMIMRQTTGTCHSCGQMATQIVKYKMHSITLIEKYCDGCLTRMKI